MSTSSRQSRLTEDKIEFVELERTELSICCPDCGKDVLETKSGHSVPDIGTVFGWMCTDCNNVMPPCIVPEFETFCVESALEEHGIDVESDE